MIKWTLFIWFYINDYFKVVFEMCLKLDITFIHLMASTNTPSLQHLLTSMSLHLITSASFDVQHPSRLHLESHNLRFIRLSSIDTQYRSHLYPISHWQLTFSPHHIFRWWYPTSITNQNVTTNIEQQILNYLCSKTPLNWLRMQIKIF